MNKIKAIRYLYLIVNLNTLRPKSGDNKNKNIKREEIPADAPIRGDWDPEKRYVTPPKKIPVKKRLIEIFSPNKFEIELVVKKRRNIIKISSNKPWCIKAYEIIDHGFVKIFKSSESKEIISCWKPKTDERR